MALSTIQKVALFSGLVLCPPPPIIPHIDYIHMLTTFTPLALGGPGRFPSSVPHGKSPDGRNPGTFFPRSHLSEAVSKAKTGGGGGGSSGRQSLVGQIIPIYGFGILLYILYILFKLSSKGKNAKLEPKSVPIGNGNLKRKITDFELSQLQDKLRETEEAMEKIISRLGPNCERDTNVSTDEEKQLLNTEPVPSCECDGGPLGLHSLLFPLPRYSEFISQTYSDFSLLYFTNAFLFLPYSGYPAETYPIYDPSEPQRKPDTILIDPSILTQPSAEEIAEQMGFGEDENHFYAEKEPEVRDIGQVECEMRDSPICNAMQDHAEDWSDEEDDPEVIAENAGFGAESDSEGDLIGEDFIADSTTDGQSPAVHNIYIHDDTGNLRKRGKKGSE
ncbi:protein RIC-3 [Pyxicephalus adspersus]|uniref:protein RIC-3 n=1 Tax=Pyxicephalus adspersus TaxID=30357 RepID=UPI003B5B3666